MDAHQTHPHDERRKARRVPFAVVIGGDLAGRHILDYAEDLSLGGIYIRTNKLTAEAGAPISVTLRIPGLPKRVSVMGIVTRIDRGAREGVAVRFGALPPEVDAAIAQLTGDELATEEIAIGDPVASSGV